MYMVIFKGQRCKKGNYLHHIITAIKPTLVLNWYSWDKKKIAFIVIIYNAERLSFGQME